MDDLDREIEVAAREARNKVWRGRIATVASTATLLIVSGVGIAVMFTLFPEDDGGVRWKMMPGITLGFGAALFVRNRLKPQD